MTLAYERLGAGPPLVLLHGLGHRRQAWQAALGRLTPHRETILVDLPGHGDSPPLTSGRAPVDTMAREVAGLFGELDLDRPHVAGCSLGGMIALLLGARGLASSVTALSPTGFWLNRRQLRYMRGVFRAMQTGIAVLAPVMPTLLRSTAGRGVIYAAMVARPSRVSPEQAAGDVTAFLAAKDAVNAVLAGLSWFHEEIPADVPVTIAWGIRDRLLPPSQVRLVRERLPQARRLPLPGCGHVPMTDDPGLVARVLLDGSAIVAGPAEVAPGPA